MSRTRGRIRLSHLEVVYPDGHTDRVPWTDTVGTRDSNPVTFTKSGHERFPRLPRVLAVPQRPFSLTTNRLRQRAYRLELERGTCNRYWPCKPKVPALLALLGAILGIVLLVLYAAQMYPGPFGNTAWTSAVAAQLPATYYVLSAVILVFLFAFVSLPFFLSAFYLWRLLRSRGTRDEILALRTTSAGLYAESADGSARFFPWQTLRKANPLGGMRFDPGGALPVPWLYAPVALGEWMAFRRAFRRLHLGWDSERAGNPRQYRRLKFILLGGLAMAISAAIFVQWDQDTPLTPAELARRYLSIVAFVAIQLLFVRIAYRSPRLPSRLLRRFFRRRPGRCPAPTR